jgi:hypothetical protein
MTHDQDEAFNVVAHSLRLALSLDHVRWELATSRHRLLDAISSAPPRGLDSSLYGEAGLRSSHEAAHTESIKRWRGNVASRLRSAELLAVATVASPSNLGVTSCQHDLGPVKNCERFFIV